MIQNDANCRTAVVSSLYIIGTLMKGSQSQIYMKWPLGRKTTDGTFTCKYCKMKFEDEEKMKRHTRKAHNEKGGDMPNFNPFGGT